MQFSGKIHLSISGVMAFHITLLNLFPIWRILIGPLSYPALVTFHYATRSMMVSYMSLATLSGLVQLGLVVSFERVVALREDMVMLGVAVSCLTITVTHLLLEAAIRCKFELLHIARSQFFVWLSEGIFDPLENMSGTGLLFLPHCLLLLLTNFVLISLRFYDRAILARYRIALATSGANGRLTISAFIVLAIIIGVALLFPLFKELDQTDSDHLSFGSFFFGAFVFFWLGCGSFLADAEPRQFIFRRLGRAWAGWRVDLGAGRSGVGGEWRLAGRRGRVTNISKADLRETSYNRMIEIRRTEKQGAGGGNGNGGILEEGGGSDPTKVRGRPNQSRATNMTSTGLGENLPCHLTTIPDICI